MISQSTDKAQGLITVMASFGVMLCLGGVYAWSIFVPGLIQDHGFSSTGTQLVFGSLIAVFPVTMIFAGKWEHKLGASRLTLFSGLFFAAGYLLAAFSNGNYFLVWMGVGGLAGIGTGLGYLVALTTPVRWFPRKKGLITGIAAGGFGLAAVTQSALAEHLLLKGFDVLEIFLIVGVIYGSAILFLSIFLKAPSSITESIGGQVIKDVFNARFFRLFLGIFCGTFAGLLVIGNLRLIGEVYFIDTHVLVLGVSFFALANFAGRLSWGILSDYTGARVGVFFALLIQSIAIFCLGVISLTPALYLGLSIAVGFGFGGNFVLFAKETAQVFGIQLLGRVYPYVFLGYALAGIIGPITGGVFFDLLGNYSYATIVAAGVSMLGSVVLLPGVKARLNQGTKA